MGNGCAESACSPNLRGETGQASSDLVTLTSSNKARGCWALHYQIGGEGNGEAGGGIIDGLLPLLHFWTPFFMLPIALNMLHDCKREKKQHHFHVALSPTACPPQCGDRGKRNTMKQLQVHFLFCPPALCTHPAAILTVRCTPGSSAVSLLADENFSWCGVCASVNISSKTSELCGVGVT